MTTKALFVRLEAKPGKESEVAKFLRDGQALVQQEPATTAWFGIQLGPTTFGIFDAFPDDAGRDAHLSGRVAKALMKKRQNCWHNRRRSRRRTYWPTGYRAKVRRPVLVAATAPGRVRATLRNTALTDIRHFSLFLAIANWQSTFGNSSGGIAQLVERQLCKLEVRGSNPLASTARRGGNICKQAQTRIASGSVIPLPPALKAFRGCRAITLVEADIFILPHGCGKILNII